MLILLTDGVKYPKGRPRSMASALSHIVYRTGWLVARIDQLLCGKRR